MFTNFRRIPLSLTFCVSFGNFMTPGVDVRLASSFGKKNRDYVVLSKSGFYVH